MRGLLTADLHIHPHRALATTVDGMNSRLKSALDVMDHMIDVVNDNDLDFVAIAGDLFEVSPPFAEAYNWLSKKLTVLGQISNVYLIAGNHDLRNIYYNGDPMDIPFLDFNRITGVRVLNTSEATTNMQLGDDVTIAGFHHQHLGRLQEQLEAAEPADILLLHQMVAGAQNDAGFRFSEGLTLDNGLFKKFGLVICGDIHKPQQTRSEFLIPGAPMHLTFGDESERYFWLWTDGVVKPIKTKAPKFVTVAKESDVVDNGNFYRIDTRKDKQLERLKLPGAAEAITDYCKQKDRMECLALGTELTNEIKVKQVVPSNFVLDNMELAEFGPFETVNMKVGRGLHMILGECAGTTTGEGEPEVSIGQSNGAGKSTLFEGISWTLYGKTAKGIKAGAVMRRTRKRGKQCSGKLVFRSETRGDLIVTRTQKAKGSTLGVELAGKPYEGRSRDQQKDLTELLGFSYEFFRQMVYFGQSTAEFFSQMGDADRKQILSKLIGLEWYDEALKEVKARYSRIESLLQTDKGDLDRLIAGASVVANQVKSLKEQIKAWHLQQSEKHSKAHSQAVTLAEERDSAAAKTETERQDFESSVKEEWANVDRRYKPVPERVAEDVEQQFAARKKSFQDQVARFSNQVDEAKRLVANLPSESDQAAVIAKTEEQLSATQVIQQEKLAELSAARQKVKSLIADRDKKKRVLSGAESIEPGTRCVTCGVEITQDTKGNYLHHLQGEVGVLNKDIESVKARVTELDTEWGDANETFVSLNKTLAKERKKLQAIEFCARDVTAAEENLESADESLQSLDLDQKTAYESQMKQANERHTAERSRFEKDVDYRRSNLIDSQHQHLQILGRQADEAAQRATDILNEECPHEAQLESAQQTMKRFTQDQQTQEASIEKGGADLEILAFWVKGFGREGIPAALLDGFCTRFTEEANAMLSSLSTGMRVLLSPSTTIKSGEVRDRLEYTITTKTGESSYEQLSGGEKVRMDVVSMLTLHAMAATQYAIKEGLLGMLILDEVFSALDGAGCELVYQMLESFEARAIYVISHNDVMKLLFRNVLVVRKVEETSVIV